MTCKRVIAILSAILFAASGITAPASASTVEDCKITSPPQGWPNGGIDGYNTRLHMGHNNDWNNQPRPVGEVKAIMLFVDFPNAPASANAAPYDRPQAYYDFLAPSGSQWFRTASYGRFQLTVDAPRKWYRMSRPDKDYGFGYIVPPEVQSRYIQEAVRLADADIDFSKYQLIHVVPVRNAAAIPYSPEWNDYAGRVSADGKVFKNGVTFGQDAWRWGYKIFNHENGHAIGLPENYNATGQGSLFGFTGGWDVMGNIGGAAPDLFSWEKWKLGWIDDQQVACVAAGGQLTTRLTPVEIPGGTKMLVVRTGRYTALVAEARRRIGLDSRSCDEGLLVYRLDASVVNGAGPIRVQDAHPGTSCGGDPLNDAAYNRGPGEVPVFTDSRTGTRIEVAGTAGSDYLVRVSSRG